MFGHGRSSVIVRSPIHNCTIIKMFKALLICALIGLAVSSAVDIEKLETDVRADGFEASLKTSDGTSEDRSGDEHGNVHGNFEWVSPEGEHIAVTYVANELGYQPSGAHLPVAPPTPEAILKSLEYLASHPNNENHH